MYSELCGTMKTLCICLLVYRRLSDDLNWPRNMLYRDSVLIDQEFIYVSGSHNKKIYQVQIH